MRNLIVLAGLSATVGLLASCAQPGGGLSEAPLFQRGPAVSQNLKDRSQVYVTLVDRRQTTGRSAQAIAGLTYDAIGLELSNANGLMARTATASLAPSATVASGSTQVASQVFTNLRAGSGYALSVALTNSGSQVGHGRTENVTLPPGVTTMVTVVIGKDGQVAIDTSSSAAGNSTAGTAGHVLIVKGDTVSFTTGFNGTESSVASYSVIASGALFSDGQPQTLANFEVGPSAPSFAAFTWSTGTANSTNGAGFDPTKLTTSRSQDGSLIFRLFDASNRVIGETTLPHIDVTAPSNISLTLE